LESGRFISLKNSLKFQTKGIYLGFGRLSLLNGWGLGKSFEGVGRRDSGADGVQEGSEKGGAVF
jgi:hypothetical protein